MAINVRRESPPAAKSKRGRPSEWPGILAKVEAGGVEWFRIGEYASQSSASSTGNIVSSRLGVRDRFEFTSRTIDGRGVLYARLRTGGKA